MIRAVFLLALVAAFLFGMRTERHMAKERCADAGGTWGSANLCEGSGNG